ncbi:MAG: hypothetical protein ACRETL_03165, partial [Gammaproteobacteria bacterium]
SPIPVSRTEFASGYVTGPIKKGKATYIVTFDADDRAVSTYSLLNPSSPVLAQLGVAVDSVTLLTQTLSTLGVPLTAPVIPTKPRATQGSAMIRTDYKINAVTSFTFTATGNWRRFAGAGISPLKFPSVGGESWTNLVRYKLQGETYFHRVLEDFNTSVTLQMLRTSPYIALPGATARVGVVNTDGRTGLGVLGFGGAGSGASHSSANSWDAKNEISWSTPDTKNQFKLMQELRIDWGNSLQTFNQYGFFTYQSLADLAANLPSSFSRTLSSVKAPNRATIVALSLGDIWRIIPGKLEFQGGVRFDARSFRTAPQYNVGADSLYGVRTDRVPTDHGYSPRLGFSWSPRARKNNALADGMAILSPTGGGMSRASLTPLDASGVGLLPLGSDVTITGGIGAYRGVISPMRIGALADATGLPSTAKFLTCVGDATPIPNWAAPSGTSLDTCAGGVNSTPDAGSQQRIVVFDPRFRAPLSWRGDLQLLGW